jgi:hypothetical protein
MLILPLFVVSAGPAPALADEIPFRHLTGKDIRAKVIGKVVTDGAHWSDYFDRGGALISWSQGRKSTGTWEIRGAELCLAEEAGAGTTTCYEVWVAADAISLDWTASRRHSRATCGRPDVSGATRSLIHGRRSS